MLSRFLALLLLGSLVAPVRAQWTRIDTNGLPRNGIIAVSSVAASDVAVLATANGGLYRSTNDGTSWTQVSGVPSASVVSASGASALVQNGTTSVYVSTDHGATFTARPAVASLANAVNAFVRVQTSAGRSHAYISSTSESPNKLWVTHDDFATVEAALPGETIEQVTTNGTVLLASSGFSNTARYFRSTDGGRTWAPTASPGVGAVAIFGASDSLFVAGLSPTSTNPTRNMLFGSRDGAAWTELTTVNSLAVPIEADPGHSAVFSYAGSAFFLSVRNGRAAQNVTTNFPAQVFGPLRLLCHQTGAGGNRAITSRYAYAMATCDDAGQTVASALYRHPVAGARTTALEAPVRSGTLALGAPAPNPSRGGFTVTFAQAEAGPVDLVVVDLLGRTVATLTSGIHPAGETVAALAPGLLPAGVYLIRLTAGGHTLARPVVITP